jgi:hypothetical protein
LEFLSRDGVVKQQSLVTFQLLSQILDIVSDLYSNFLDSVFAQLPPIHEGGQVSRNGIAYCFWRFNSLRNSDVFLLQILVNLLIDSIDELCCLLEIIAVDILLLKFFDELVVVLDWFNL